MASGFLGIRLHLDPVGLPVNRFGRTILRITSWHWSSRAVSSCRPLGLSWQNLMC